QPAVRLARADLETAGEHRSGQRHRHAVTDGEVDRAADDAARRRLADLDLAVADGLFEPGELLDVEDLAHHDVLDLVAVGGDPLQLQTGRGELVRHLGHGDGGQVDVLPQPGKGDLHPTSIPN